MKTKLKKRESKEVKKLNSGRTLWSEKRPKKKKLLIRQAWAKNEFSSPEEKTSPPTSKNIYGEFIDIGKWNESS